MRLWTVWLMCVALVFVWACDSNETTTDNGQVQDVVDQDTAVPDTAVPDVAEDANTGVDTNAPVDTNVPEDQGNHDDTTVQTDLGQPEVVVPLCPSNVATGATCQAAGSCAVQCDDDAFQTTCLTQVDQAASDAFAAFKACAATSGCEAVFANEQVTDCITAACKDVTDACFVGTLSCKDVWNCRKDCAADDPGCPMACVTSGTLEAQAQWVAYKDCVLDQDCASEELQENGWPAFTCEQYARGYCDLPYQGCFPPI